jgi:hypothetical protein
MEHAVQLAAVGDRPARLCYLPTAVGDDHAPAVATGELPPGHATEDGVGLHYVGTELAEAVTVVPGRGPGGSTATGRSRSTPACSPTPRRHRVPPRG